MSVKHTLLHCLSVLFIINNYAHRANYKYYIQGGQKHVRNDKENHPVRYN